MRKSRFRLGPSLDSSLLERVEKLFEGANLIETILYSHLLVERALTARISEKLVKPTVLEDGFWSFNQKLSLYIGLFDPREKEIRYLRGINRLRNSVAHQVHLDAEQAVTQYLPWEPKKDGYDPDMPRPPALGHVRYVAGVLLMDELRGIDNIHREPIDWDNLDDLFKLVNELVERDEPKSN
jgi:hypothetical protein